MTITEFIEANLARIERERCNARTITNEPVMVGGRLVQYVGMSGDSDGTYIEVRDPSIDAMTPPGEDVPRITRILTPAEREEFREQCPLSGRAREARRWVAGLRAVVEMHIPLELCRHVGCPPTCAVCSDGRREDESDYPAEWPCPTIRAIAGIFADQPGYDEEWR